MAQNLERIRGLGEWSRRPTGFGAMSDTADKIDIDLRTAGARVCEEPECATRLSRYNEFEFCALHQPMVVPRMRGKVIDEARESRGR